MKKNVASQTIGAQLVSDTDGSNFTGTASVSVTIDAGVQAAGGGTVVHEGNGYHSYAPTQAETNGDHIAFTFTGTGAISSTSQVYTNFPQTADNTTLINALNDFNPASDTVTTVTNVTNITSAPSNWSLMAIDANGVGDSFIQGFLNTLITETSAGRIANNFDFFYDNSNVQTTKVVEDVGSGGSGDWTTTEKQEIRGRLGVTGTTSVGGNTPTLSTQSSVDVIGSNVDEILNDTNSTIPGLITALNNISAAQVNTEVLDVLTVDTFAELVGVNAATDTILNKLTLLNMALRNKTTQTSSVKTLFADNTTTPIATSTVSDDATTFTKGELT